MARAGLRVTIFGLAAAGLLMGCVNGGGNATASDGPGLAAASSGKTGGTREVEAPEVFQATDSALWDGRPSLGGIWVAAPDATNPERVLIFNPATGKSVTGALFRRERENPGPRLQLSSDAAEALGILAGQPTEIRVTALRKVEEKAEPEVTPPAVMAAGAVAAGAEGKPAADPAKSGTGEAAAIASAALAAVDGKKPAAGSTAAPGAAADPAAVAAAVATDGAAAAEGEKPVRKTWKERRAEARAAREAKKREAAEAKAAAAAAAAGADTSLTAGAEAATPAAPTATSGAVAPIASAPLDARDPNAVAAKPSPASKRKTVGDAAAPAPASAPAKDAPVVAAGPVRPIQVASFSKEDNARRATEALARIGITATTQKSEKDGKAVWGVVVQGDEAMLKKIKDAGFADAYFLK